eukprot:jgi/Chlat1/8266/Chrsp78S07693
MDDHMGDQHDQQHQKHQHQHQHQHQMFSVRIVGIDHYMARPVDGLDALQSPLTGGHAGLVPIIRIFGATPAGQKTCLHVHKASHRCLLAPGFQFIESVLPYFYIPYDDDLPQQPTEALAYVKKLAAAVEKSTEYSGPVTGAEGGVPTVRRRARCLHSVTLVRARPFYGYNVEEKLFVKIILYKPHDVGRIASVLQSGAVLNRKFQPHEAHIPYLLQFKASVSTRFMSHSGTTGLFDQQAEGHVMFAQIDFNLQGMGHIHLSKVKFRNPLPIRAGVRNSQESSSQHSDGISPASDTVQGAQASLHSVRGGLTSVARSSLWTQRTAPADWQWGGGNGQRPPERQTYCELEADGCAEDILNGQDSHHVDLNVAPDDLKMVQSLAPIWEEERLRGHSMPDAVSSLPPRPKSPVRTPHPFKEDAGVRATIRRLAKLPQFASLLPSPSPPQPSPPSQPTLPELVTPLNLTQIACPTPDAAAAFNLQLFPALTQRINTDARHVEEEEEEHMEEDDKQDKEEKEHEQLVQLSLAIPEILGGEHHHHFSDAESDISVDDKRLHRLVKDAREAGNEDVDHESQECQDILDSLTHEDDNDNANDKDKRKDQDDEDKTHNNGQEDKYHNTELAERPSSAMEHPSTELLHTTTVSKRKLEPQQDNNMLSTSNKKQRIGTVILKYAFNVPEFHHWGKDLPRATNMAGLTSRAVGRKKLQKDSNLAAQRKPIVLAAVKPPPSRKAVEAWLAAQRTASDEVKLSAGKANVAGDTFVMDPNTGKLVPAGNTEAIMYATPSSEADTQEDGTHARPASPKYNEGYLLSTIAITEMASRRQSTSTRGTAVPSEHPKQPGVMSTARKHAGDISQISPPGGMSSGKTTPMSQLGFKLALDPHAGQQVTLMSIEVHSNTRGDLLPNPQYDAVRAIIFSVQENSSDVSDLLTIALVNCADEKLEFYKSCDAVPGCDVRLLSSETAILDEFVSEMRHWDADIVTGYDVQGGSVGYLLERSVVINYNLHQQLSRTPNIPIDRDRMDDEWGRTHGSGFTIPGRISLNVWRLMRGEVKLNIYTFEVVTAAVLRRRVPHIPARTLTQWFDNVALRWKCLSYFARRCEINLQLLDQLDMVNRTAEFARVFGIDFYSVISRGSQYRVESMLLRLARTQNYVLISPSKQQVAEQPGMECLPLVMEPESRFYADPVIVLDFQSLYPSMVIAYNLCYSTCLGRVNPINPRVLGVTTMRVPNGMLDRAKDMLLAPNGIMFVAKHVRKGVLPRLLSEILDTRIMVKGAMKRAAPTDHILQRVLNARQFGLKLIANVTYGYTAAGFSGRMPCSEIADSIVQTGRATLERAIQMVESNPAWGARVVYGDTDSMFVLVPGRSRGDAHRIGAEIAAAVTAINPAPVTLQMEKVYHPCILLSKKRYVGYKYESAAQTVPVFDAKGIETVRRDSCGAVAKTLEASLRKLFETKDLSLVKHYLQRQWAKVHSGRINLQDFVFAKEVKLGTYSARYDIIPPAAIVASKAMANDPRAEPRYGERVPYVVIYGEPGARLIDTVVSPRVLVESNGAMRLHATYYITKQIVPTLMRAFSLLGADVRAWYNNMPRAMRAAPTKRLASTAFLDNYTNMDNNNNHSNKRGGGERGATIDHFYLSRHCAVCGEVASGGQLVCSKCAAEPHVTMTTLTRRAAELEQRYAATVTVCAHCGGADGRHAGRIVCDSLDCGVYFLRRKLVGEARTARATAAAFGCHVAPSDLF